MGACLPYKKNAVVRFHHWAADSGCNNELVHNNAKIAILEIQVKVLSILTDYRDISQLVDGVIWGHEVVGSSPTIPTYGCNSYGNLRPFE